MMKPLFDFVQTMTPGTTKIVTAADLGVPPDVFDEIAKLAVRNGEGPGAPGFTASMPHRESTSGNRLIDSMRIDRLTEA